MDTLKMIPFEEELKRNPELKIEDVEALREWLKTQPHLPPMTDSELAIFLHSNYYNVDKAKLTIDAYYTIRTQMPHFSNRDPVKNENLQKMMNVVICIPLTELTDDGYGILYYAIHDPDPSHYNYDDAMKLMTMIVDSWLWETTTSLKGHIMIMNISGLQFGHMMKMSLSTGKKFTAYQQDALPMRLKGMHCVYSNSVMDIMFSMMKPFMKKELQNMIHMHQKPDTLKDFNIPLEILPNEVGGKAGPQKELFDKQVEKLIERRNWFIQEEKTQRVDEAKRPGKTKSDKKSLKKLEFD